jgi:hypothetical protein
MITVFFGLKSLENKADSIDMLVIELNVTIY